MPLFWHVLPFVEFARKYAAKNFVSRCWHCIFVVQKPIL